MEGVVFDIELDVEESVSPSDAFPTPDDNAEDQAANEKMLDEIYARLERGDLWAFCSVCVSAKWTDPVSDQEFEGTDYLGCCSYDDEEDFTQEGGYYPQMKKAAYADLVRQIQSGNGHAH